MPIFTTKKFIPSGSITENTLGALYRRHVAKHPFLLFGLPFVATIVAGSFLLTPATALRYEKHDRKIQRLSQEEALGLGKDRRKVDLNEEYYVSFLNLDLEHGFFFFLSGREGGNVENVLIYEDFSEIGREGPR
jgi:cytochrome c oxidase assembly protein subunit 16